MFFGICQAALLLVCVRINYEKLRKVADRYDIFETN